MCGAIFRDLPRHANCFEGRRRKKRGKKRSQRGPGSITRRAFDVAFEGKGRERKGIVFENTSAGFYGVEGREGKRMLRFSRTGCAGFTYSF